MSRWRGGVVFSPGLMAFTGRIGDARAHAHAAVQVLFVARGRLTLTDSGGGTAVADAAIIPPGVGHEVHADADTSGFVAFLDPDSTTARAALRRLAGLPADQAASWVSAATPADRHIAVVRGRRASTVVPIRWWPMRCGSRAVIRVGRRRWWTWPPAWGFRRAACRMCSSRRSDCRMRRGGVGPDFSGGSRWSVRAVP